MPTAYELLTTEACDDILTVDLESRTILIPKTVSVLGVESDDETRVLHFRVPRYYCNVDLSEFDIRINYRNAKGEPDMYIVTDSHIEDDTVHFDWVVGRHAFVEKGNVSFVVCLKDVFEGVVRREFNTAIATLPVLEGLETGYALFEGHTDIFEQLREELTSDADEIVSEYLEENLDNFKGPPGPKGDAFEYEDFTAEQLEALIGPQGNPGVSIQSITRTSGNGAPGTTDTYTITLTDGSTATFQVYNGANGEGAGDMTSVVYDPQSKKQDIFKYVDDAMSNIELPGMATTTELGLVMVNGYNGIGVNTENGNLFIKQASNNEIDGKEHSYKPITPENLDYAVKAGLVNNTNEFSDSERTSVLEWIGAMNSICRRKDDGNVTDLLGCRNGRYIFSNEVTGMPIDNEWWFVDTLSSSSTDITVIAYPILTTSRMYIRTCANDVWGDWCQIAVFNSDGILITEGNIEAHYLQGEWLQTTADTHRTEAADKIAVLDGSGWVYHRTPAEALSDMGGLTAEEINTAIENAITTAIGNAIGGSY